MPIVALWEFAVLAVRWVLSNKVMAAALVGGASEVAEEFAPGELDVLYGHVRNMLAKYMNSTGDYDFTGDDFRGVVEFSAGITRQVSRKAGIPLRNLMDKQMMVEDLENHALYIIGERSGIHLSSLRNVEVMKQDFLRIAGGVITERTGIPFTDLTDVEAVKADVMTWAQDQAMLAIGDDVHAAVNAEWQNGVSLLQMVKDRTGKDVSPKALLRGVNDAMVQRYMVRIEKKPGEEKRQMRRYRNMMYQRKFRAKGDPQSPIYDGRVGGKTVYQPKGFKMYSQDGDKELSEVLQ